MKDIAMKLIRNCKTAEDIRDILVQSDIDAGITVEAAIARLHEQMSAMGVTVDEESLARQSPWFDARTAACQYYYTVFDFRTLQRMLRQTLDK